MKSVCVFCASSNAIDQRYMVLAEETGCALAGRGMRVVYGGAKGGMMGRMADAALGAGGEVIGVIPEVLTPTERAHQGLSQLYIVGDMHERQRKMAELSDGFLILPGGLGTLAELFEILTWKAIGLHNKKIGLVNFAGFWTPLLAQIAQCEADQFLHSGQAQLLKVLKGIEDIDLFLEE